MTTTPMAWLDKRVTINDPCTLSHDWLTATTGSALLRADIEDTRNMLAGLGLTKKIPVGNSDAGSFFSTEILSSIDYGVRP
jgi:hypothetical protein